MSIKGYKMTEEHKRKISEAHKAKGKLHWMKRPEVIAKIIATKKANPQPGYWLGKKRDNPKYLDKISKSHLGQHSSISTEFKKTGHRAYNIVGGKNAYRKLHKWVEKYFGKPNQCSNCEKIAIGKKIHWANMSGEYRKIRNDWKRLCAKCHFIYDRQSGFKLLNRENNLIKNYLY